MSVTFRRRVDNLVLRWQARLDSEWADRVLPWLVSLGLFVWLAALALGRARSLEGATSLADYTQAAWLIRQGDSPIQTITENADLLAQQASFLFYPMVGITFVLSIIPGLLVLQSAALAIAVVPLWRIARKIANLRVGATATLIAVYALYPVMHNLNLDGFHPEVVAVPGLLSAFYFGFTGRWRLFIVCCAVVVLARADLGLAVAGMGGLLMVEGRRRLGLTTLVAGAGWTLLCFLVLQPIYGDGGYPHVDAFAHYGDAPLSVVWGMVSHPEEVLRDLLSEQNFNLLVTLFAPVLFLPLLAPRYLIPVLPLQALYMVADVPTSAAFGQQTVAITAFIFIASAMALSKIGRMGVEKIIVDKRVLGALLLAGAVFFVRDAASSPYREPWDWGSQNEVDQARLDARDVIPDDASVRASTSMLQILAERHTLYELALGDKPDVVAAADGVDYLVVDDREIPDWTQVERQIFRNGLESAGFVVIAQDDGITVYERGPPGR